MNPNSLIPTTVQLLHCTGPIYLPKSNWITQYQLVRVPYELSFCYLSALEKPFVNSYLSHGDLSFCLATQFQLTVERVVYGKRIFDVATCQLNKTSQRTHLSPASQPDTFPISPSVHLPTRPTIPTIPMIPLLSVRVDMFVQHEGHYWFNIMRRGVRGERSQFPLLVVSA